MRKSIFLFLKKFEIRVKKIIKALLNVKENGHNNMPKAILDWFRDEGDKTHRLNYNLTESSLVFDLGGFEGQWTSDIYSMYNCNVYVFEPYLPFAENIEKRFSKNSRIKVFKYGLGNENKKLGFTNLGNASSALRNTEHNEFIEIVSVSEFIANHNIQKVDLIKINIEGGEYELLDSILENGVAAIFENIQVQFHDSLVENARQRMTVIQSKLALTHDLTYQYDFVWENWRLKTIK